MEDALTTSRAILRPTNNVRVEANFIFLARTARLEVAFVAEPLSLGNFLKENNRKQSPCGNNAVATKH